MDQIEGSFCALKPEISFKGYLKKNYLSIPEKFRPLKGRTNIILSRNPNFHAKDCVTVNSLEYAIVVGRQK